MDVTDRNFRDALALLRKYLPNSDFVAFDLEFTGLGESRPSQLDTPQTRYADARADVEEYVPIQAGLAIFRRQGATWRVLPFNFNLAPAAVYYPQHDRYPFWDCKFTLQGSTVAFLSQHGFNFDKCFRLGVSWLSKDREKKFRQHVEADVRRRREDNFNEKDAGGDFKILIAELSENITKFMKDSEPDLLCCNHKITQLPLSRSRIEKAFTFRYIRKHYPRIAAKTDTTQERETRLHLELYKTEEEASARREEFLLDDVDDIVSPAVGFRYVIDLMLEARIPLIVHNGLIDITKLYGTFVGHLPHSLQDFKQDFRKAFPVIYDTRLLIEQLASQDAAIQEAVMGKRLDLSDLVSSVRDIAKSRDLEAEFETFVPTAWVRDKGRLAQAQVTSDEGFVLREGEFWNQKKDRYEFGRYSDSSFGHEAGFDSVQTGFLFGLVNTVAEKGSQGKGVLDAMEGKILLASCGGYQWVDFASTKEDEVNCWFGKDVIIVSRSSTGKGRLETKNTLETIFRGTKCEAIKPHVTIAGPDAFIVTMSIENPALSDDIFRDLETNASQIGVEISRYHPESLSSGNIIVLKNKKRKFSGQSYCT